MGLDIMYIAVFGGKYWARIFHIVNFWLASLINNIQMSVSSANWPTIGVEPTIVALILLGVLATLYCSLYEQYLPFYVETRKWNFQLIRQFKKKNRAFALQIIFLKQCRAERKKGKVERTGQVSLFAGQGIILCEDSNESHGWTWSGMWTVSATWHCLWKTLGTESAVARDLQPQPS